MATARTRSNDEGARHIRFDRSDAPLVALASDLDRTLVKVGSRPSATAREALRRAQHLGLRTLLVSGRRRPELDPFVAGLRYLDAVVAENGAIVETPLGATPQVYGRAIGRQVRARLARDPPITAEIGEVVVSVLSPAAPRLRRRLVGLPVDFIGNVRHTMALPHGITKRSGTRRALRALGLDPRAYAAIGDAQNDLDLLEGARLSGAVANAEPSVRAAADYTAPHRYARGVLEFVQGPIRDRLRASRP